VRTQRLTVEGKVAVVLTPRAGHRIKEVYRRHWDAKPGRHQLGIVTEFASCEPAVEAGSLNLASSEISTSTGPRFTTGWLPSLATR
jgi:hypothetical protein